MSNADYTRINKGLHIMEKTIAFIGAGKMATAIIKGLLSSGLFDKNHIIASEPNAEYAHKIGKELGIKMVHNNREAAAEADIILLAVKPFVVKDVLTEIEDRIDDSKLLITIAAGISTSKAEEILEKKVRIIKVMPNTPALLEEGMSAVCKGEHATDEDFECVKEIFSKVGKVISAKEEDIDAITGVSGSGPAFYYYIINEIAKAGEKLGLDYKTALTLSAQTALGSAKMILETNVEPEQLITNVTTPGGTTAEGNKVLSESSISDILFETVKKTAEKSELMGKQL